MPRKKHEIKKSKIRIFLEARPVACARNMKTQEGAKVSRRPRKRVNEIFEGSGSMESLLVEVVDDTLKEILGKNAAEIIYDYLKNEISLGLEEIPRKPEAFSTGLNKFIGSGSLALEKAIVKNLYSKLRLEREEKEGFMFSDHVKFILSYTLRHKSARKTST
jgi:hypothetical protein